MPGKIDAYNLGDLGVDLVSSPLHSADGTMLLAQNVIVEPKGGQHAIAKRPGHTKLNTDAAAGALLAICPIPFADPSSTWIEGTVLVRRVNTTDAEYTTDGVTWNAAAGLFSASPANYPSTLQNRTVPRLYYVTTGGFLCFISGNPPANTQVDNLPSISGNGNVCAVDTDEIYFVSQQLIYQSDGATNTLLCANPWDGSGVPGMLFKYAGELYCASTTSGVSGKIYRYAGGTTWTEEAAFTDVNSVSKFCVFHGRLYACLEVTGSPDGGIDKIVVRVNGTWQSVHDATGDFYGICAFNEQLFVARKTATATEIWVSSDGETWTLDEDLNASFTVGARETDLVAWNGNLYALPTTKSVYKRTPAGAWSESDATPPLGIVMGAY